MNHLMQRESIETDVLIVGSGAAGLRAAMACVEADVDCILVSKGRIGTGGGSFSPLNGLWGIQAALALTDPSDSPEKHFQEIQEISLGMCDSDLAQILVDEAPPRIRELEEIGVQFKRIDGQYEQIVGCFCNTSRALQVTNVVGARNALASRIDSPRVKRKGGLQIVQLLLHQGTCVGAVGYDEKGVLVTIRARSTILASGGGGAIFRYNLMGPDVTGDGYVFGYEAGAQLTNMEFIQVMLGIPADPFAFLPLDLLARNPRFLNAKGDAFMAGMFGDDADYNNALALRRRHYPFSCRDDSGVVDLSITKEILRGRCTRNFGVRMEYDGVERDYPNGLEVAPFAHSFNGGLKIDAQCATTVDGLFAAGEAAGGVHGADRPGGNMLASTFVFGARAGQNAAARAREATLPEAAAVAEQVDVAGARVRAVEGKDSVDVEELHRRVAWGLWKKGLVIRSEGSISSALGLLHDQEEQLNALPKTEETDVDPIARTRRVLETQSMIKLGALVLTAALARRESRGAHYREDFPMKNDKEFGQPIILSKTNMPIEPEEEPEPEAANQELG